MLVGWGGGGEMRDLGPRTRLPTAHLAFPAITNTIGSGQEAESGSTSPGQAGETSTCSAASPCT